MELQGISLAYTAHELRYLNGLFPVHLLQPVHVSHAQATQRTYSISVASGATPRISYSSVSLTFFAMITDALSLILASDVSG